MSGDAEVLARLIEAVPGGVVQVAADGAVLRANPAATAFLGLAFDALTERYTQDFAGETWFEDGTACGPESYPVSIALITGKAAGPTTIGVKQPNGRVRWAVFRAVPVEGGGAVVTFLDITERLASERRVRISDRLASLGRLAAGVAHEVNNPLTWVILNLERALEGAEPESAVRNALEGLDRVTSIVRDLGAFARIDNDAPAAFDVHTAIDGAIAIAKTHLQHRATLDFERAELPLAFGIEGRVTQILLNLLLNAAQAIEPGQRARNRVTIRTRFVGGQIVISVRDTGVGMNAHTLEHALDPFFTTKSPGDGTGLGLAISHALAAAMQGSLEVDSQQGHGTSVRLSLPVAGEVDEVEVPVSALAQAVEPGRVLVIDDEAQILEALSWALESHEIHTASTGREALELLNENTYDAILCDLMMPEVTGMMLHAELARSRPELLDRLVFFTGGAFTDEAREFWARDDIRRIRKPFRIAEVREVVAALTSPRP